MIFGLEALPAEHGDCLLLRYGQDADPRLALIDGGPGGVYERTLRGRLNAIRDAGNMASLPIHLLIVSHVDDDHINGVLDLTHELTEAFDNQRPLPYQINALWHNSFDEIIGNNEVAAAITAAFGAASLSGTFPPREDLDRDVAAVLASVRQGHRLRNDAKKLGLSVNRPFPKLVQAEAGVSPVANFGDGLQLQVIGPMHQELKKLQDDYDKFLRDSGIGRNAPEAALAAFKDKSVANLSSIIVLAKFDQKQMLLTGDARGDKIMQGLEQAGLLPAGETFQVDLLKLQHHGSVHNVAPEFFSRILADHYVISGNGVHGNPDRETLAMLFAARPEDEFSIHLTYPVPHIDRAREAEWTDKFNSGKKNRPWSAPRDSLDALFDTQRQQGHRFKLSVPPAANETGVRIDLLP
jgi:hypothetical protein